eukprot:COSAG01_NODE_1126_length_11588_cov_40.954652_6_plen_168_part_00
MASRARRLPRIPAHTHGLRCAPDPRRNWTSSDCSVSAPPWSCNRRSRVMRVDVYVLKLKCECIAQRRDAGIYYSPYRPRNSIFPSVLKSFTEGKVMTRSSSPVCLAQRVPAGAQQQNCQNVNLCLGQGQLVVCVAAAGAECVLPRCTKKHLWCSTNRSLRGCCRRAR